MQDNLIEVLLDTMPSLNPDVQGETVQAIVQSESFYYSLFTAKGPHTNFKQHKMYKQAFSVLQKLSSDIHTGSILFTQVFNLLPPDNKDAPLRPYLKLEGIKIEDSYLNHLAEHMNSYL